MIINYAHRGASGYFPENTMLAFEKAIDLGADGIETDVQMTKDGTMVLIHDELVNRTTNGIGLVKDYRYEDLSKLDAGSRFNEKFRGEKIPTLEELLTFAKERDILLNIELKTGVVLYPGLEEKLIGLIYEYGLQNKVILSSFNHYSMVHCKEIAKEIKTGLLYMAGLYEPQVYCKLTGADAIHPYFYSINKEIIDKVKKEGILVNPFTINDEPTMINLIKAGVDGMMTNYPDKLSSVLKVNKNA